MKKIATSFARFKAIFSVRTGRILLAAAVFVAAAFSCLFPIEGKGQSVCTAAASSGNAIAVHKYEIFADIKSDRRIVFEERITVEFLTDATMFFRSLPIDQGDRYFDTWAKCEENDRFRWDVVENPQNSDFLDIECIGNADRGKIWTYTLGYTMLSTSNEVKNGMILDLVGSGWGVALDNVDVNVTFPAEVVSKNVYSGEYGSAENRYVTKVELSSDKKTLTLHADKLPVVYNNVYGERMAAGVTLKFELEEGGLDSYAASRIFTFTALLIFLAGVVSVAAAFVITRFTKTRREIVRVVNLKAPQEMDPLKMGKLIDGTVDDEDITSMIYWLASKGYLTIDLSDENNPIFTKTEKEFPQDAPAHQRAIYNGLFKNDDCVDMTSLKYKFYTAADKAKQLVTAKDVPHYEKKSVGGFILCGLIAALLFMSVPLIAGLSLIGGGYSYFDGAVFAIAVLVAGVLLKSRHDRQFKNKRAGKAGSLLIVIVLAALASLAYIFFFGSHILTGFEKLLVCVFAWIALFVGSTAMSYTEKYTELLGDILGFKDFIVYTEEDKIKFMLQENPEMFYDILPYAQVLGVTDEWEDKFKTLTLEPPTWCENRGNFTLFDYYILRRCMRNMAAVAMARPASQSGSFTGRSGGGGGFGGFSGGGHGGGGGGAR